MGNGHNLFIAFHLIDPMDNHDRLGRAIGALGVPVKISRTLWYVDSPVDGRQAELMLRRACNHNDTLLVIDASSHVAVSHNLRSSTMLRTLWNSRAPDPTPQEIPAGQVAGVSESEGPVAPPELAWLKRLFSSRSETGRPPRA